MIYCGELKQGGVLYHSFYDKETRKLRFFHDGQEVENDHLNNTYNKPKNCFRGYSRMLTLLVSLGIITSSLGVTAIQNGVDLGEVFSDNSIELPLNDELSTGGLSGQELYDEMVRRNPDFAEYLEMTREVIIRYGEYMDQDELLRTIDSMEIVPTSNRGEFSSGKALAFYTKDENKIYIDADLNIQTLINTCLYHEILHYYSQSGLYDSSSFSDGYIGYAINEGLTEYLNAELNDSELFTYHKEAAYVGALCEIVGPEVFVKAYFGNNIDLLLDEMAKYTSYDEAVTLIKNMDIAKDAYDSFVYDGVDDDYENFCNISLNIWDTIGEMYEFKYGKDINDDQLMMAYKSASMIQDFYGLEYEGFLTDIVVHKHYFSSGDDNYVVVDYCYRDDNGMTEKTINIDTSNRLVNMYETPKKSK